MSSGNSSLGIIVGIDDSPAAQVAVRWAARDAELRKIPLTLVHAVSPEVATWLGSSHLAGGATAAGRAAMAAGSRAPPDRRRTQGG